MKYQCECLGCKNMVEKTIVCSQSCRMKLRRKSVTKDNKDVRKDNATVKNPNAVVKKDNDNVTNHNAGVMNPNNVKPKATKPDCPFCKSSNTVRTASVSEQCAYRCYDCHKLYDGAI